jgi:hypothetical protein
MITFSPTLIVLKAQQKEVQLTVKSDSKNLEFSLIAYNQGAGELKQQKCSVINTVHAGNSDYTIDQQQLIEAIKQCQLSYKNYAVSVIASDSAKSELSSKEQVILPIVNETSESLLQKERTATVLGELSSTYQVEPLSCTPRFTWTVADLTCSTVITNTSDTAVLLTLVSSLRENNLSSVTVYEKVERSSTLLLPNTPYSLSFIIPKEKYSQGDHVVASKVAISMIGSVAQSFTVVKESGFTYISPYFIAFSVFLVILISGILVKNLLKFTATKKHGAIPKTT